MSKRCNTGIAQLWVALIAACAVLLCCPTTAVGDEEAGGSNRSKTEQGNLRPPGRAKDLPYQEWVNLPPGRIEGRVTAPDRLTPCVEMRVALLTAGTGQEVMSTVTDVDGAYVLANVPVGDYTLWVGNPGLAAPLHVTEEADGGSLDAVIPAALAAPVRATVPEGVQLKPFPAVAVVGADGTTLMPWPPTGQQAREGDTEGPARAGGRRPRGSASRPAGPPPWLPGPPPWVPGPPPWVPGPPPWISPIRP